MLIQYKDFVPICPYLFSEGDEIVRACDRHWDETVTLTKQVTKYKYMRKWMAEFLSKSQSRVIKIAWVNLIRMPKSINLHSFLMCRSSRWRHLQYSFSDEATCYSTMVVTVEISTDRSEEYMLLFSCNTFAYPHEENENFKTV